MRIAKICEDDTQVNSLYKVFNCCLGNPYIARQKIIPEEDIGKMKKNLNKAITDDNNEKINLIKSWRDKYLAHCSKLINAKVAQEEFRLDYEKLDNIINILYEILDIFNRKFNLNIDDKSISTKIAIQKSQFNFIYNIIEEHYKK